MLAWTNELHWRLMIIAVQDPDGVFRDVSICEVAEIKRRNVEVIAGLLSAPDSQFGNNSLIRLKKANEVNWVEVQNSESVESIRSWIAQQRGFFDPGLNTAPKDYQTILEKAPHRFQRTGRTQKVAGKYRRIYRENETARLFYVDEGHPGGSAHLEVFDSVGNHLGEASIVTGDIDYSKADAKKKISN